MANNSIINHMINVLNQYEARTIRAGQVEVFLEQYAHVLEGVSADVLSLVRQGAARLANAEMAGVDEKSPGVISLPFAVEQLRVLVRSLSGQSNPDIVVKLPGSVQ